MGHYRSEMGLEDADTERYAAAIKRENRRIAYIEHDIAMRGVARVLSDIVANPVSYGIKAAG